MIKDKEGHRRRSSNYYYKHRDEILRKSQEKRNNKPKKPNGKLEYHHNKYKELDGKDEIIIVNRNEHQKYNWLSRHGLKPKIPIKIMKNACNRLMKRLDFTEEIGQNIQLHEMIRLHSLTGKVHYNSRFRLNKGNNNLTCLPVVDENVK